MKPTERGWFSLLFAEQKQLGLEPSLQIQYQKQMGRVSPAEGIIGQTTHCGDLAWTGPMVGFSIPGEGGEPGGTSGSLDIGEEITQQGGKKCLGKG